jgi:hypothetical protein
MATEIAMLSTESEYMGVSCTLIDLIPIIKLLKEMKDMEVLIQSCKAKVHYKVYKDNSGALELLKNKSTGQGQSTYW